MFNTPFISRAVRALASILVTLAVSGCSTVPATVSVDQVVESLQTNKGAL